MSGCKHGELPSACEDCETERIESGNEMLRNENERLRLELQKRDKCSFMGPMRDCPTHGESAELKRLREACAGLPDGALDGGWTAAGLGAYAAKLERALKPFAEHPDFQAPDDWAVTLTGGNDSNGSPVAGVTAGDFRRAKEALKP